MGRTINGFLSKNQRWRRRQQCKQQKDQLSDTEHTETDDDFTESHRSHNTHGSAGSHQSTVRFCDDEKMIQIREIPSHRCFSLEEKRDIWNDSRTIQRRSLINQTEYIYEGGRWESCVESDEMRIDD